MSPLWYIVSCIIYDMSNDLLYIICYLILNMIYSIYRYLYVCVYIYFQMFYFISNLVFITCFRTIPKICSYNVFIIHFNFVGTSSSSTYIDTFTILLTFFVMGKFKLYQKQVFPSMNGWVEESVCLLRYKLSDLQLQGFVFLTAISHQMDF